ncbi:MAG: HPP family protein [Sneathiellaceae bacterium]
MPASVSDAAALTLWRSRRNRVRLRRLLRALGPPMARPRPVEIGRAGLGAALGLTFCALLVAALAPRLPDGMFLVAPLGASAVLLFAVPNSPLAQPWAAIVGNGAAAFWAVAVTALVPDRAVAVGLAVGGAIALMLVLRALHPPGGAVALYTALDPGAVGDLGFGFALFPVMTTTALLVCLAILFNRLTGRRYPFRQPAVRLPSGWTGRSAPAIPDDDALAEILSSHRLSANLGVADLRRLIVAAELRMAVRPLDRLRADDLMARDLAIVPPGAPVALARSLFYDRRVDLLVVADDQGVFQGLLGRADLAALPDARGLLAADVMSPAAPWAVPETPAGRLFDLLADDRVKAIPVLHDGRVVGLVRRAALVALVAGMVPDEAARQPRH